MICWLDHQPPVSAEVACQGASHRVTWRRGRLILDDHPNLTAERSLVALGGDEPDCLFLLRAWGTAGPTTAIVARCGRLLSAGPDARLSPERPPPLNLPVVNPPGASSPDLQRRIEERLEKARMWQALVGLPSPLVTRWLLGSATGAERRWATLAPPDRADLAIAVGAAARAAMTRSIRSWHRLARVQQLSIGCSVAAAGAGYGVSGRVDERQAAATIALPVSWLRTVWGRNAAVVDGCFVVDIDDDPASVVRWERVAPGVTEPVMVEAWLWQDDNGGWRLRWC